MRGKLQTTDDILMSEATAALTHDAASGVGLAITSSNGYVDVESVRFTGLQMGLDGAEDLITLSNANVKITGTLDTTGYIKVASTKFTVDATGNTYADGTLGVKGVSTLEDDLLLSEDAAVIKHSVGAGSTTAGLSILSEHYHVDVESVRFTDAKIGTTTDADLITLADGSVSITGTLDTTGYIKVASTKFTVDATGNTYADGTLGVKGMSTLEDDLLLSEDAAVIKHSVGAGSTTAGLSILSEHYHVDVESVRFTDAKIGTTTDADLITLADDSVSITGTLDTTGYIKVASTKFTVDATGNTYADGTLGVKGVSTLEDDLLLSEDTAVIKHTADASTTAGLSIYSTNAHVDVESVRFTSKQIGTTTDADLITLADNAVAVAGTLTVSDDVKLSEANAVIEHTSTDATGGLTIKSSSGYVDVESVRFTTNAIGISGDTDIITLSSASVAVAGALGSTGDFNVATTAFTVASGTGNTAVGGTFSVAGTSTLTGAATLSSTLDVTGATTLSNTLSVGGASTLTGAATLRSTLNVSGATSLSNTLSVDLDVTMNSDIIMSDTAASLKHSAATGGLTITSENGYVHVEEVRFTNKKIGINTDVDLITLELGGVTIAGTLDMAGDLKVADTKFVVDASSGNTLVAGTFGVTDATSLSDSLDVTGATTLSNTLTVTNATTLQSNLDVGGYVHVATNKFTVDTSGNTAAAGTLQVNGATTLSNTLIVAQATTLQNTLDVASTFRVATTKFTVDYLTGDTAVAGALGVNGAGTFSDSLNVALDATLQKHLLMTDATAALTHSALTGGLQISSSNGYVDVEEVRFNGKQIGIDGDEDIMTLASGAVSISGKITTSDDIILSETAALIKHSAAAGATTGLTITSEHGYVDVESVRFTDAKIGTTTDADLITLADGSVSITGTLDTTGYIKVASTKFTVDATGNTYADGTLGVKGVSTLEDDLLLSEDAAVIKHSVGAGSTTAGLSILSEHYHVDVESVRFTDAKIGTTTDADLITLADGSVSITGTLDTTGYIKVASTKFTVDATGNTYADGTLGVKGVSTLEDDLLLSEDAAVIKHTADASTTAGLSIYSTNAHVDVESVRFTSKQIGTTTDADLITLADNAVAVAGTLTVLDDVKLSEANAVIEHTSTDAAASLTIKSSSGYVDVESVRFTTDEIGIATDADLIKLTDQQVSVRGKLQTTDDILMSEATAALTHDAASGVGLAITSSNGYVDVESVRFTGLQMGLDGAADLITLSNANVKITGTLDTTGYIKVASTKFTVDATGNTYADGTLGVKGVSTLEDDLLLSEDAAVIKHSVGAGSTTAGLSILSEHYHVDVESVRFTDAKIGTTTDADLITLADNSVSITGTLDTTGYIKVASTKFTVDATGNTYADGTLGVKGMSTLEDDLLLSEDAAVIKHSVGAGSTTAGLSILSEHYHVDVESVRFTDAKIGTTTDADLITLADNSVSITGTLDTTGYIKVASTKFTVDATGNTYADGTLGVKGMSTLEDDLLLSEDAAVIKHTADASTTAGLSIYSTNAHVDVESVRFTSKQIGTTTDADLITLADNAVAVAGTLTVSDNVKLSEANAVIEHTSTDAAASLTIKSSSGYVDVESVRFTTDEIGIATDADLIKLTDQQVSVRGKLQTTDDILMSEATAALTHDAASGVGLAITSSNGYVDVESVRFTGLQMGLDGAADLITLSNANVKITGTLDTTGYIKVASTKFTVDATGNTYADGTLGVKGMSTLEDDLLLSEDAAVIKHSVGAGSTTAGLSILSEHYHVDVESVRFTDAKIGTTTDADLITLADGSVSITGTLDTTGYIKVASTKFTVDATGNTYADGTLGVKGMSTLEDDLLLSEDAAVIKHSVGAGSTTAGLSILSEHYHVDVESVRFTDAKIGTTTDADLITLADGSVSITGTLDTTGYIKVASTKFTVDATGNTYADGTLGVKGVSTLEDDLLLSEANAVIEHTLDRRGCESDDQE